MAKILYPVHHSGVIVASSSVCGETDLLIEATTSVLNVLDNTFSCLFSLDQDKMNFLLF